MMNNMSGRVDDIFVLGGGGTATQFNNGSNPDLHPSQEWRCHVERSEPTLVHFRWNGRSKLDPRFFALLRMTICDAFLCGCEFAIRQAAKSFKVFRRRFLDNILRQTRRRRSFVPIKRLEIIADELFIEAGRALPDGVLIFWPKPRRVRRKTFVDQKQFTIDRAKLEFRVCDDDSLLCRVLTASRIDFKTQSFDAIRNFITEDLSASFHVDVLVMTFLRLCRRREDWLWQLRSQL